jgi:hypothetical protein
MLVEDISRNKCFFRLQILHVLGFIPICDLFTDSPTYMCVCMYVCVCVCVCVYIYIYIYIASTQQSLSVYVYKGL